MALEPDLSVALNGLGEGMSFYQHVRSVSFSQIHPSKILPFPARCMAVTSADFDSGDRRTYADSFYIQRVISYLKSVRKARKLSQQELARRSGLRVSVIRRAEREGRVPKTREFKAWAKALGLSWEQVWSACLPGKS
jgi:limonene-1,2-epoxide hydrolase